MSSSDRSNTPSPVSVGSSPSTPSSAGSSTPTSTQMSISSVSRNDEPEREPVLVQRGKRWKISGIELSSKEPIRFNEAVYKNTNGALMSVNEVCSEGCNKDNKQYLLTYLTHYITDPDTDPKKRSQCYKRLGDIAYQHARKGGLTTDAKGKLQIMLICYREAVKLAAEDEKLTNKNVYPNLDLLDIKTEEKEKLKTIQAVIDKRTVEKEFLTDAAIKSSMSGIDGWLESVVYKLWDEFKCPLPDDIYERALREVDRVAKGSDLEEGVDSAKLQGIMTIMNEIVGTAVEFQKQCAKSLHVLSQVPIEQRNAGINGLIECFQSISKVNPLATTVKVEATATEKSIIGEFRNRFFSAEHIEQLNQIRKFVLLYNYYWLC